VSFTIGELKARLRDVERQVYQLGALIADKPTPGRRAVLKRLTEKYDALAQRAYKLGLSPGEW